MDQVCSFNYFQDLNIETRISVSNISTLREETYLCPSSVKYVKPVRAINSKGQWRIVLNHLEAKDQFISQTIRVETCNEAGQACPKVPGISFLCLRGYLIFNHLNRLV